MSDWKPQRKVLAVIEAARDVLAPSDATGPALAPALVVVVEAGKLTPGAAALVALVDAGDLHGSTVGALALTGCEDAEAAIEYCAERLGWDRRRPRALPPQA
ncbi:MAG: hypothetical protein OXQ93_14430 [Gemmatimonadota bacterium]|nr:hypothetical protein [Gemmatimonadota bacterium]